MSLNNPKGFRKSKINDEILAKHLNKLGFKCYIATMNEDMKDYIDIYVSGSLFKKIQNKCLALTQNILAVH